MAAALALRGRNRQALQDVRSGSFAALRPRRGSSASLAELLASKGASSSTNTTAKSGGAPSSPSRSASAARGKRRAVPVLGRQASEVLPAVVGAFQDEGSRRAARALDAKVVARATGEQKALSKAELAAAQKVSRL